MNSHPYRTPAERPAEADPRSLLDRLVAFACIGTIFVCGLIVPTTTGCKESLPYVRAALSATEIACIFTSPLTNAQAVTDVCKIEKTVAPVLLPEIERMIATREAAAKAGVTWYSIKVDAGAPEGTR